MNPYNRGTRSVVTLIMGIAFAALDAHCGSFLSKYVGHLAHERDIETAEASFGEFMMVTELVTKVRE